MRPASILTLAGLAAAAIAGPPAAAQISPGELSQAHAALEGTAGCSKCHSPAQGVDAELCLDCHTVLRRRIDAGAGLHSRPDYRSCRSCHIEHHGWQFDLVWWGEGGETAFDHRLTGEPLEGAHAALECRACHRAKNLVEPARLRAAGKDLDRTFLGLAPACLSCHADEHREQFEAGSCRSCHRLDAWRPAALFDHDRSSFPLTGRHRDVTCGSCHPGTGAGGGDPTVRYRGLAASSCADCHRDPHRGRLGGECRTCHVTGGWERVDRTRFDHDRTRFPLRGRHRSASCDGCHRGGSLRTAGFERCDSCHADVHLGQFRRRADGGDCSACHDSAGFQPARFTVEDHQRTSYPLVGSHRAVPCIDCHRPVPAAVLSPGTPPPAGSPAAEVRRFRFASSDCLACHQDPHAGDAAPYLGSEGCLACHRISTWKEVAFDHSRTGWVLEGRHRELGCPACHATAESERVLVRLKGLSTACASCHRDPHLAQFGAAGCTDCHHAGNWKAAGFDHDRDARFRLEGAHRRVECAGCHPLQQRDGVLFVRYKPLGLACSDCHGVTVR